METSLLCTSAKSQVQRAGALAVPPDPQPRISDTKFSSTEASEREKGQSTALLLGCHGFWNNGQCRWFIPLVGLEVGVFF